MFEFEQEIKNWRREMRRGGVRTPEALDELESHLRNEFASLCSSGMADAGAFETAVARVGKPAALAVEFNKVSGVRFWPITLIWIAFLFLSVWWGLERASRWSDGALFQIHSVSLITGYLASYLTSGLCFTFIAYWRFGAMTSSRAGALHGAMAKFNWVAIAFVSAGLFLGVAYDLITTGTFWHWRVSAVETLLRLTWLVSFFWILRSGLSQRAIALWFMGVDLAISAALWSAVFTIYPNTLENVKWILSLMGIFYALQIAGLILGWLPLRKRAMIAD